MTTTLALVLFGQSTVVLKTSVEFEQPAWAWVVRDNPSERLQGGFLQFPGYMAVTGGVSPSGRRLVLGLGKFKPPLMGAADGYTLTDSRGLTGAYELRVYDQKNGSFVWRKNFAERATWSVEAWTRDETQALLIGGPPFLINTQCGPYRLFLLDFTRLTLRKLYEAETLVSAKFSSDGTRVETVRNDVKFRGSEPYWRWTRIVLTKAGRVVTKESAPVHD
ncbi:MAG: hypothetical protein JNM34_04455 [Chthonomonadaceae bacterium]|nr:hypothetical protein [Chthonomonadaceae bacterium]